MHVRQLCHWVAPTASFLSFNRCREGSGTHREVVHCLKAMYATHCECQEAIPAMKMETYFVTVSEQSELSRCWQAAKAGCYGFPAASRRKSWVRNAIAWCCFAAGSMSATLVGAESLSSWFVDWCCEKRKTKAAGGRKSWFWPPFPGYSPPQQGSRDNRTLKQLVARHIHHQEAEVEKHALAQLPLSAAEIQSRIPARRKGHLHWAGLTTSVNTVKIILHRCAQRPVFRGISDPAKVTVNADHHTWVLSLENAAFENNKLKPALLRGGQCTHCRWPWQ